jgi:hypothetical protein
MASILGSSQASSAPPGPQWTPSRVAKSPRRYRFARAFAAIGLMLFYASVGLGIYASIQKHDVWSAVCILCGLVVGTPTVFMILNLAAFPFDYSVFGRNHRTLPPEDEPLAEEDCGAQVGSFRGWCVASLYRTGLGLRLPPYGPAFLRFAHIAAVERGSFRMTLHHTWPEIRTPILLPRGLYERFQATLNAAAKPPVQNQSTR